MPVILLVRHAQASYGSADYDALSSLAAAQSQALRKRLPMAQAGEQPVLVAGPGCRHRETAAQSYPGASVNIDPRWGEYAAEEILPRYGDEMVNGASLSGSSGLSSREFQIHLDLALSKWLEDPSGTWPSFKQRTLDAVMDISRATPSGRTAVVFTSAGPIASVAASLLGSDQAFVALNRVQVNTGVTKLIVGRSGTSLVSFNDHAHLEMVDRSLVTHR